MKYKRVLSLLLALLLVVTAAPLAMAVSPNGDVDNDGLITPADARLVLRAAVKLDELTAYQIAVADLDMDGEITSSDARLVLRLAVGLPIDGVGIVDTLPDNPSPTEVKRSAKYATFKTKLYEVAHPLVGSYKTMFSFGILKNFQKWCCYYTIHDVFRPALEQSGYSAAEINKLAPNKFSKEQLSKALKGGLGLDWPLALIPNDVEYYVPSLLMNHYYISSDICDVYNMYDYYDDVIEGRMYYRDERDVTNYSPQIGDVLFMSNKTRTYEYGYPTIDHTAQIIEVYPNGTFLCTEGSIIENAENDGIAKVRERTYHYNPTIGTYEYDYNSTIIVLTAVRPYL